MASESGPKRASGCVTERVGERLPQLRGECGDVKPLGRWGQAAPSCHSFPHPTEPRSPVCSHEARASAPQDPGGTVSWLSF